MTAAKTKKKPGRHSFSPVFNHSEWLNCERSSVGDYLVFDVTDRCRIESIVIAVFVEIDAACFHFNSAIPQRPVFDLINTLAHTKWNCKYRIVFAPKYRRKVFYEEKRMEVREILRQLYQWKGVESIEGEICPDHVHLLVSIPPKMSVSGFMGYLKGKSMLP